LLCGLSILYRNKPNLKSNLLEEPDKNWEKPVLITHGPGNFAVRLGNWRYIRYQNGDEELYDVKKDPKEFDNLAGKPAFKHVVHKLEKNIPNDFVRLYDPLFGQFENLDTMRIFQ